MQITTPTLPASLSSAERRRGAWLGLAVGDALGAPVEFMNPEQVARIDWRQMRGGAGWDAGEVTDDTDLTLANAAAYDREGGFDLDRAADAAVRWFTAGPKDVGGLTADALQNIARGHADARSAGRITMAGRRHSAGNGSLMRAAPTALARRPGDPRLVEEAVALSAYTHADPRCTAACVAFCGVLSALVHQGAPVEAALDVGARFARGREAGVDQIMQDVLRRNPLRHDDAPMGYVLLTLERALVAFRDAPDFDVGVSGVIARGGDADTNACVAGALLGARFGPAGIPEPWRRGLAGRARLDAALEALPDPR